MGTLDAVPIARHAGVRSIDHEEMRADELSLLVRG